MLSLRTKLTLWYLTLVSIVIIGFGITIYLYLSQSLLNIIDLSLMDQATILANIYKSNQDPTDISESSLNPNIARIVPQFVQFIDVKGQVVDEIQDTNKYSLPVNIDALPKDTPKLETLLTTTNEQMRTITLPIHLADNQTIDIYIRVGQSLVSLQAAQKKLFYLLIITVPLALLFASLGGLVMANKVLSPIGKLSQTALHIGASNLKERVPEPKSNDELSQLASLFNEMLSRLEKAFERERQFTADASHELRTPLAIIRGELEIALRKDRSTLEYKEILSHTLEEVLRLSRLTDDLLTLARSERGELVLEQNEVILSDLVQETCQQVDVLADAKGLRLSYIAPKETIKIVGDAKRLRQLLLNLLDNAIKYSSTGEISVLLTQENKTILLSVADTGCGIAKEELSLIFDRFYRHNHVKDNNTSGFGLGLAICKWIVEAHRGEISATSELGQGSKFTISIPTQ